MEPIAAVEAPIKGRLGERLLSAGKLNERDLQNALQAQQELGGYLGQVLVQLGVVAETDVAQALAEQLQMRWLRAEEFPDLLPDVPGLLAYTAGALVVAWLGYAWFQATRKGFADVL